MRPLKPLSKIFREWISGAQPGDTLYLVASRKQARSMACNWQSANSPKWMLGKKIAIICIDPPDADPAAFWILCVR